jgi:hypothetical protein
MTRGTARLIRRPAWAWSAALTGRTLLRPPRSTNVTPHAKTTAATRVIRVFTVISKQVRSTVLAKRLHHQLSDR